jgi:hypothetical protein
LFVSLTLATFLKAEFGFFGVTVYTLVHTPRFCGHCLKAGALVFIFTLFLFLLTSWLIVGKLLPPLKNLRY